MPNCFIITLRVFNCFHFFVPDLCNSSELLVVRKFDFMACRLTILICRAACNSRRTVMSNPFNNQPPICQQPDYQSPAYRPSDYQPPVCQQPDYQPPVYRPSDYQPSDYQPQDSDGDGTPDYLEGYLSDNRRSSAHQEGYIHEIPSYQSLLLDKMEAEGVLESLRNRGFNQDAADDWREERKYGIGTIIMPGKLTIGLMEGITDWIKPKDGSISEALKSVGKTLLSVPVVPFTRVTSVLDEWHALGRHIKRWAGFAPPEADMSLEEERALQQRLKKR